jgi:uncharacterized protein
MPIHVAITRKVLPGKEEEFKDALRRFLGDSFLHGGVHGAAMMTALPGSESREIGIFRTFIVAGCMVGLLTWVVMPRVTKALKP